MKRLQKKMMIISKKLYHIDNNGFSCLKSCKYISCLKLCKYMRAVTYYNLLFSIQVRVDRSGPWRIQNAAIAQIQEELK
jgi:hypothetical protein